MNKKGLQIFLAGFFFFLLSACETQNGTAGKELNSMEEPITLEIRNPKVEISTQFEQMVRAYEKENPGVKINVRTVGGAADDLTDLKAQIAAGEGPDIFTNGGYEQAKLWSNYLEDLSDQPWVENVYEGALEPMTIGEGIYGMPVNVEGYGFIYNKDLFEQVGIETLPKTLTELIETAESLEAAGITPFATGYYEDWKLSDHLMGSAFARQDDPDAFIAGLNDGSQTIENNETFKGLIQLLDVTLEFGNDDPLTTDYHTEVTLFANGEAAMIQQGNWIQPLIDQLAPNMNIGFLPIPVNDSPKNDVLAVDVPNYWVVNQKSTPQKKQEAKKFLNWMVSTEEGQKFITEQFKFIPAFKHIEANDLGPLAEDVMWYVKADKTLSFHWFKHPEGTRDEFGFAIQAYVGNQLNRDQLLQELQKSWERAAR
ncbi:carbohydrate ABC transporter substrate-binding protein [Salipaludibacillus agaradhaerens]|uniref:ABC transporter substrate-binding protein n=1 Tax=Salipaludibacillus agaradhaerens TaxID=76935 RepID=UPI0021514638|nr:ABC transporter substrate-binding protein [Salipaludibacillus agaradhaerens]MCR6105624.1 carbohydrate ABC transporter substrate-binding protein [Salipaludibacillus agaradhaerens]MCR6117661.1 carbohydrate ABC transporter substrate-binding protein [Salipaludibacillus agaradhaerens]